MLQVKVECIGVSPLLMDMMDPALESLHTGVRLPLIKDIPAEQRAEKKIYRDKKGEIGIPTRCLFACLVGAGRLVKNGKRQISNAGSTTLQSLMSISDSFLRFNGHADKKWVAHKERGRLQDGTAVCIVRPRFDKWGFDVNIEINDKIVSEKTIRELFDTAGSSMGLCAYRPNCKGLFGRFKVQKWTTKKMK